MTILFYSTKEVPYGCFSNFSAHGFELDGLYWPTSEHYFQANKFIGTSYYEQIRLAKSPMEAAKLGRSRSVPLRSDWESVKDEVMYKAVLQKFRTHEDIKSILLSTGEELIIENAPGDYYWGVGRDGTGKNKLGLTLMKVRSELVLESRTP